MARKLYFVQSLRSCHTVPVLGRVLAPVLSGGVSGIWLTKEQVQNPSVAKLLQKKFVHIAKTKNEPSVITGKRPAPPDESAVTVGEETSEVVELPVVEPVETVPVLEDVSARPDVTEEVFVPEDVAVFEDVLPGILDEPVVETPVVVEEPLPVVEEVAPPPKELMTRKTLIKLKKEELQEMCADRGLVTEGTRPYLIEQLLEYQELHP